MNQEDKDILLHLLRRHETPGISEQIELLQLEGSGIKVAQYMTELPPRGVLLEQMRKAQRMAEERGLTADGENDDD